MDNAGQVMMKKIAFGIAVVLVLPLYLGMQLLTLLVGSERPFVSVATALGLHPGVLGDFSRKAYYYLTLDCFSPTAGLGFGSFFSHRHSRMGPGSSCGAYCILGTCEIGSGVLLGSAVHVLSGKGQHAYDENGRLIDGTFERIAIGDNTWIGNGAIIMASVGRGCIIGAGAVVVNEVRDHCIVGGNPARVIRQRDASSAGDGDR
jgi:acetyltransferase-like isoleucine patch superfamily enzyme